MISQKQLAANRANAMKSTGPRTAEGKARAAGNALRHGLVSERIILAGLEEVEQWQHHLEQTLADLAPEGQVESLLAQRIALLLWLLWRAARYEQESAAAALEKAQRALGRDLSVAYGRDGQRPEQRDQRGEGPTPLDSAGQRVAAAAERVALLARLRGLPADEVVAGGREYIEAAREIADLSFAPAACSGQLSTIASRCRRENVLWTAGELIDALNVLAESGGLAFDGLYAKLTAWAASALARTERRRDELYRTLDQNRRLSILPDGAELAQIIRHEAHLERMFTKAMQGLRCRQARRMGQPGPRPLPLAVDATGGGPGPGG